MVSAGLKKTIKKIIGSIPYEQVLVFGSRARDSETGQSDIDLLVITKQPLPVYEKMRLSKELRMRFAEQFMDVDILIKDRQEVDYLKDKCGSIVRNALKYGVVV